MAFSGLLALLDDISAMMDDVAVMTKTAASKTTGLIGDDLALNAQQVLGTGASRELHVVWAVAKGSMVNKAILVPAALGISAFAPFLITPFLMLGGAYLCYEGVEKLHHSISHRNKPHDAQHLHHTELPADPAKAAELENKKIKGAVRTDFILSAEIVAISLGAMATAPLLTQVIALSVIGAGMTVIVYGPVAALVRFDDWGIHMMQRQGSDLYSKAVRVFGKGLLQGTPLIMKTLSVLGTGAMFLVGGGLLLHNIPGAGEHLHHFEHMMGELIPLTGVATISGALATAAAGIAAGAIALGLSKPTEKIYGMLISKRRTAPAQ